MNEPRGVEHGFTILASPPGRPAQLELLLAMSGNPSASSGAEAAGLRLRDAAGSAVLAYRGLHAFDATGRTLSARTSLPAGAGARKLLRIVVDVIDAVDRVVVDPLIATEVKKLTAADPDVGDKFGVSVSSRGNTIVIGTNP